MTPDFHYSVAFPFYRLFPNNPEAVEAWREIAKHFEGGSVPVTAWDDTARQLRAAGYTLANLPKGSGKFTADDEALLRALEA